MSKLLYAIKDPKTGKTYWARFDTLYTLSPKPKDDVIDHLAKIWLAQSPDLTVQDVLSLATKLYETAERDYKEVE